MAGDANTVLSFLQDLAHRAKPQAEREFEALATFAQAELALETSGPWDAIQRTVVRPPFPLMRALTPSIEY